MSTSDPRGALRGDGFSLVELLVAVVISLLLVLAVAPLWSGLQSATAVAADRVTLAGQSRIAIARLERDLRTAAADPTAKAGAALLLRADSDGVVLLVKTGAGLEVVEWEIAGQSLMRRRGTWAGQDPASLSHAWFTDHKTQLSGIAPGTSFSYVVLGTECAGVGEESDRARIEAVLLRGAVRLGGVDGSRVDLHMAGWVGR